MNINTVYCGDAAGTMNAWPDNSVDLFVWSPPYDKTRKYKGYTLSLLDLGLSCYRVLKPGGVMAVVIQDGTRDFSKSLTSFRMAVDYVDLLHFKLFECIIYQRPGKPGAWWNQRFRVDHEYIMIFFKGNRPAYFNKVPLMIPAKHAGKTFAGTQRHTNGDLTAIKKTLQGRVKCPGTIWPLASSNTEGNKLKLKHPATFPDKLAENLILCFSQPGELVVDPLCGSGTTLRMSKKHGRNYIGIDISEEYCQWAKEGLENERQF
jgi:DNA modification methylase